MKFPFSKAKAVAKVICDALASSTEKLIVAGSMRRRKSEVGDIEILYIPVLAVGPNPDNMFETMPINQADQAIDGLLSRGVIAKRKNAIGRESWGRKNKLAVHVESGIPVDLFATDSASWWNYLVCRTGPSELNVRICSIAQNMGWKWNPYGTGFTREDGTQHQVTSEADVFQFVGLRYMEPWERKAQP